MLVMSPSTPIGVRMWEVMDKFAHKIVTQDNSTEGAALEESLNMDIEVLKSLIKNEPMVVEVAAPAAPEIVGDEALKQQIEDLKGTVNVC